MSDFLKHECGIAAVRLRKPLAYYYDRYGTCLWGLNKLFLLMEKQHNRGQDGTGIGCVKLDMPIGQPYVHRRRGIEKDALAQIFRKEIKSFSKMARKGIMDQNDPSSVKKNFDFGGEILLGHLRYGTSGEFDEGSCHPYLRRSNWPTRTLMVMGNFNMTNAAALNQVLIERGQHPVFGTDTQTVLEEIGYHLDEHHTDLYRQLRDAGVPGDQMPPKISEALDVARLVAESASAWDGGYTICGAVGNGDMFVMRDPRGIRPCHMLITDEVVAFASERVPLMTVFEAEVDQVKAVDPGSIITIKSDGTISDAVFAPPQKYTPCSFEKIYFSRGNDPQIYRERKAMGAALVSQVVASINGAFDKTVFSFIPNTAETAYHGLMDGLRLYRRQEVRASILKAVEEGNLTPDLVDDLILRNWPCGEKVAHKDIKLRTFISQEKGRDQLVSHVYDITYGVVKPGDYLVALDDSIVRGTTLKKSILKILARTKPSKIVVCSTAPQIRYPDCYGIDMSELGKFIAFQAAVALHRRAGRHALLDQVYEDCRAELQKPAAERTNRVCAIYDAFTDEEISAEISRMVYPEKIEWDGEVEVIFQSIENLRASIKGPSGDWYFTGNYPTAGGFSMVNAAYIRWHEGVSGRSYDLPL
ncbi:amidophosphoribosyltransferase [Luteolibacter pohnpeiensis]|uniref:Amidophosphoribosyltransferase n=1 Tax=Luteolibacter pohnpeiensis TaxID=454153 RepID=A0A934S4I1_9BACT|nr:amidophosphoribosyltransferase [Luteolibacter pohnpeiensis]MBK1881070.1 amidophosphoribosyltransferase [Luteolibacter pohnpeiensis]